MDLKHSRILQCLPPTEYGKVRRLLGAFVRNRPWFINRKRVRCKEYLDLGCGLNTHEDFINLDYEWNPEIDICWDITKGIPLPDGAVRGVFSEHCIEHLPFGTVRRLLGDVRRVIRSGGCARIVVPDGELYLTRYTDILRNRAGTSLPYAESDNIGTLYSPIISVNRIFRGHGHLFIYDFDLLRQLLEELGFVDIRRACYREGRDHRLLRDSEARAVESLYVEASVP